MKLSKLITLLVCLLPYFSLTAKADNNNNGQGHAYGHDKNKEGKKVPIDGGITLLLAAGTALGLKRVVQRNKKGSPDA